jgi:hypothetical protein
MASRCWARVTRVYPRHLMVAKGRFHFPSPREIHPQSAKSFNTLSLTLRPKGFPSPPDTAYTAMGWWLWPCPNQCFSRNLTTQRCAGLPRKQRSLAKASGNLCCPPNLSSPPANLACLRGGCPALGGSFCSLTLCRSRTKAKVSGEKGS